MISINRFSSLNYAFTAIYMMAVLAFLLAPFSLPNKVFLNVEIDKWMHFLLFCGFAFVFRWILLHHKFALSISIGTTVLFAGTNEFAQSLFPYRDVEVSDLLAGFIGALLGAFAMHHLLRQSISRKSIGLIFLGVGIFGCVLSLVADAVGFGETRTFGTMQLSGTVFGVIIGLWGIGIYRSDLFIMSRMK